jgi:hypothetical protein
MVMRTIEIAFEVPSERQEEVIKKIKALYPDLKVHLEDNKVLVRGDLSNYKRRGDDKLDFIWRKTWEEYTNQLKFPLMENIK